MSDSIINPLSGKPIVVGKKIHKQLEELNILVDGRVTSDSELLERMRGQYLALVERDVKNPITKMVPKKKRGPKSRKDSE